jgi:hypothetical protein
MAEQERLIAVLDIRGIAPGIPHSRCQEILQEAIEGQTYSSASGDLTFTVVVEGFGPVAAVREC